MSGAQPGGGFNHERSSPGPNKCAADFLSEAKEAVIQTSPNLLLHVQGSVSAAAATASHTGLSHVSSPHDEHPHLLVHRSIRTIKLHFHNREEQMKKERDPRDSQRRPSFVTGHLG